VHEETSALNMVDIGGFWSLTLAEAYDQMSKENVRVRVLCFILCVRVCVCASIYIYIYMCVFKYILIHINIHL